MTTPEYIAYMRANPQEWFGEHATQPEFSKACWVSLKYKGKKIKKYCKDLHELREEIEFLQQQYRPDFVTVEHFRKNYSK